MPINIASDYKLAFKDADIRGVYPKEIDEELTYFIARAFVDEFNLQQVLVACDMRHSSPALHSAFLKGVCDAGAEVIDLGLVDTPRLYFASGHLNLPGVMITASHSPKNYNGLKLVLPGAVPLTEKHGLKVIRKRIEKGLYKEVEKRGRVKKKNIWAAYQRFILAGFKTKKWKGVSVVADFGNGMGSTLLPLLTKKTSVSFTSLFSDLDGSFPRRGSDPTLKKNQKAISATLKEGDYDFGVAFDGDADRIAFFDEHGTYVNSAVIGALISEVLLKKQPGSHVVYTNLTSRVFEECIKKSGGKPVIAKVGHAFIKETMRKKTAIFGCEHSGHLYFASHYYADSVALPLLYVLDVYAAAKSQGLSFSELLAPYRSYEQTEDVIVEVDNPEKVLLATRDFLLKKKPLTLTHYDGYAVDFGEVWGSVKVSVTEPALKIMFESKDKRLATRLQRDVVSFVKSLAHN